MSKDTYRKVGGWYTTLFEPLNSGLRAIDMKIFPPSKGMFILDVGCGTGVHLELYQKVRCTECLGSVLQLLCSRQRLLD